MPDVSLNGIEFKIKGSTGNASSSIDSLVKKLDSLKTALANAGNVKVLANGLKNLQKAMESIAKSDVRGTTSALKELGKTAESLQGLANISKDLASFARAMVKLSEDPSKLLDLAQALQVIGSVDLSNLVAASDALRSFSDAMRAVNSGNGRSGETEAQATAWSKLGDALRGVANAGARGLSGAFKILSFPFKGIAKDTGNFAKSLFGVVSGFKRILGYRIIRSIIKEITQAFSEGIKNLYGWSKAMGGATISGKNFAQTMDGLATSSLYFKNSIGAMVAPIISALAPAIDYIIDKVVALINVINQLFALLSGATSWNRATRKATEFEEAAGGAGGAAKEALRYLAPFDELNRLPDDNKGGGGGGSADDYSGMFEEQTEFLEGLKDFADSVRAAIDAGDWEGLGVLLGDKVNELIEKIDFEAIGSKVGESINALFTTRYWTLKEINFQNIGAKIAEFLNSTLSKIDFETVGRSFTQKFTLIPDVIIGFLGKADWTLIGKSVGDYLRGAFNELGDWANKVDWNQVATDAITAISNTISGFDLAGLLESVTGVITKVTGAIDEVDWGQVVSDVFDTIVSFVTDEKLGTQIVNLGNAILKLLGTVVGAVIEGIGPLVVQIAEVLTDENTWKLVGAWLQDLPAKFKQAGINIANNFVSPIIDGINNLIEQLPDDIKEILGIDGPISFQMIPDIPEGELNKHYDEAKRTIEGAAEQDPPEVPVKPGLYGRAPIKVPDLLDGKDSIEIPVKPGLAAGGLSASDFLLGKDAIEVPVTATVTGIEKNEDGSLKTSFKQPWMPVYAWAQGTYYKSDGSLSTEFRQPFMNSYVWGSGTYYNSDGSLSTGFSTPFINTRAFINRYEIKPSLQSSAGDLKINGTFNVVRLTGNTNIDQVKAGGGVYTSSGWKPVQSFAGGGSPFGGQIFRARENGNPELVGTLRGSTAVMNNDQIVASVSSGVARAIAGIHFQMTGLSASAPAMEESANEDTMYRAFRRALDETDFGKDISIDGEPIYQSVVRRNRQNTRATGVNQLAMA